MQKYFLDSGVRKLIKGLLCVNAMFSLTVICKFFKDCESISELIIIRKVNDLLSIMCLGRIDNQYTLSLNQDRVPWTAYNGLRSRTFFGPWNPWIRRRLSESFIPATGSFGTHVSEHVLSFYFISGSNGRTRSAIVQKGQKWRTECVRWYLI